MGWYEELDGLVTRGVFDGLNWAGINLTQSPVNAGLPCVDSPTPIVVGLLSYISFVFLGLLVLRVWHLKPRTKDPLPLQLFVLWHNFFCFALSLYMCIGIVVEAVKNKYTLWNNAYNPSQTQMGRLVYLFYMSKYVEFMDTVIMILKRNTRQITVLHVYHHASISFIWWMIAYHAPGGEAYFSAALNSGVHVFMYLYYLLAATLGKDEKVRYKYLWWGKYLTQLQMFQFCLNLYQAYTNLENDSPYPRFLNQLLFYYMISLLVLFANFYVHRYLAVPQKKAKVQRPKKVD